MQCQDYGNRTIRWYYKRLQERSEYLLKLKSGSEEISLKLLYIYIATNLRTFKKHWDLKNQRILEKESRNDKHIQRKTFAYQTNYLWPTEFSSITIYVGLNFLTGNQYTTSLCSVDAET